ncbi:erythrocyte membrane protein 1, PfEMP1, putative [Plasmodium reichenowi]|uniref:Erythrocyte membrane protein 1, PfEMP1, putative n=1 Tax=Plasmodium reichenowi TaxID=5854 RepID=A0A2P9D9B9_PLARE|nr:erythrocyte membrane protein 1, PfEMP1, putative [Plasmodium reichenowi]
MRLSSFFVSLIYSKGDYNIPTLKSLNRHFPYARHLYKGKTYIYLKEDSGHNYEDTTDVTTSEIHINYIYAPVSPKYKILFNVVLEPTKKDTRLMRQVAQRTRYTYVSKRMKHRGYMYKKWNDHERLYKLNHKWNMEHNEDLLNINTYISS